jgi:hypothetical protein
MGRDDSPADAQITRAFIAVALGLMLAFWVLRPACVDPGVRALPPELRLLADISFLVT